MCHGVFDVVHPGHIRHLAYAKSKAKILIVSITADIHIKKAKYILDNRKFLLEKFIKVVPKKHESI